MNYKPNYQKYVEWIQWILIGIIGLGSVFDSYSNAISIINLKSGVYLTITILFLWIGLEIIVWVYQPEWFFTSKSKVKINSISLKIRMPILGMLVLIWIAFFINIKSMPQETIPLKTTSDLNPNEYCKEAKKKIMNIIECCKDIHNDGFNSISKSKAKTYIKYINSKYASKTCEEILLLRKDLEEEIIYIKNSIRCEYK